VLIGSSVSLKKLRMKCMKPFVMLPRLALVKGKR